MSTNLAELGRLLLDDLEQRDYAYLGVVRQLVAALAGVPKSAPDGCAGCGAELDQSGRGRPRRWCAESCRRRHRP
jgi:hypothetical protein